MATREGVGQWTVHQWIKKAVLLSFRLKDNELMQSGDLSFYDKVPTKFAGMTRGRHRRPPACAWCHPPWPAVAASSPRA